MTREIPLTQGQVAIVCECCYHKVKDHKWSAKWNPHKRQFSAGRDASIKERLLGMPGTIHMHAVINGTPSGIQTDHIDNNSLNNRCSNLRTATPSENARNRTKQANNTSGFKGVRWRKEKKKWWAEIQVHQKCVFLGYFDDAAQAARAYDQAARQLHGEFARLNFPES